jgi:DNA-binding transcriptional regulator YiaG
MPGGATRRANTVRPSDFIEARIGYCEEKGISQTQRPVSPQRTSYEAGRRIREMRGFDMTQAEFAERVGISQNYLSTLERATVEIGAESRPIEIPSSPSAEAISVAIRRISWRVLVAWSV